MDVEHTTKSGGPLEGLLVVALEQAVAAPICSTMLANSGARVIKVERPEGDFARDYDHVVHGESAYFVWLNGGKESVCVDLVKDEDRALLTRMIGKADVFIQNLKPGAAARYGYGSDHLRDQNPRLITVDISGYGETGDYAGMKAYDLLIQGETGLASITGTPEAPGRIGVSICDIACGMYAYSGVLEALLQLNRTGEGDAIKVSLFDAAANWMTVPLLHQDYGGMPPPRMGLSHPSIAPYGVYVGREGMPLLIAVQNQREWRAFCVEVLEAPGLIKDTRFATNVDRVTNRTELDSEIAAIVGEIDDAELVGRVETADLAYGRVNSVAELSDHPQLRRVIQQSPTGAVNMTADPVIHSGWSPRPARSPALGEHDASVRTEFAAIDGDPPECPEKIV